MEKYFDRKVYNKMLEWKEKVAPNYALFLKGARRTGKSTLAERLGKQEYKSYIIIRFDKASSDIKRLFVDSLENLDELFNVLQLNYKTKLYERESLIILDEIQLYLPARQALKTLLEDKRYDYIETGSLAGIERKSPEILIPSEEYPLDVLPMDFEEFLWSQGDNITMDIIRNHYQNKKRFGSQLLNQIKRRFREYICIGGMPQAIEAYCKRKDFGDVDFAKQMILNLYREDMGNQEEESSNHIVSFFEKIPSELSKHDKRYKLNHIEKNSRNRDYKGAIKWLNDAKIINIAEKVSEINVAFNLTSDDSVFKCYLQDTGLLISLAYKDRDYLENELYLYILKDNLQVNEGMIIENVVAQCLKANGHAIYYYKKTDEKEKKAHEVDFVLRDKKHIQLIEVKSSNSNSIKSLKYAKKLYGKSISEMIVLHDGEIKWGDADHNDEGILYLPYFMACVL